MPTGKDKTGEAWCHCSQGRVLRTLLGVVVFLGDGTYGKGRVSLLGLCALAA